MTEHEFAFLIGESDEIPCRHCGYYESWCNCNPCPHCSLPDGECDCEWDDWSDLEEDW